MDERSEQRDSDTMTLSDNQASNKSTLTTDEVRQGVTGNGVRYVLAVSLALSLVALLVLAWHHVV